MKKTLIQKLGLLGVVSFLSYMAAVIFAPLAYPGYDWMAQAVSDLSAANAPSLALWNQLSSLYNACELPCVMIVCVGIPGQKNKLLRVGIYLFAAMEWVSAVGFRMFPLSDSGYAGAWQDQMHLITTALVVALSITSLLVIIIAGAKERSWRSYGVCAGIALAMMLVGALGDAAGSHGVFRRGGTVQCICRHRLQRGAGSALFLEKRDDKSYKCNKSIERGVSYMKLYFGSAVTAATTHRWTALTQAVFWSFCKKRSTIFEKR